MCAMTGPQKSLRQHEFQKSIYSRYLQNERLQHIISHQRNFANTKLVPIFAVFARCPLGEFGVPRLFSEE